MRRHLVPWAALVGAVVGLVTLPQPRAFGNVTDQSSPPGIPAVAEAPASGMVQLTLTPAHPQPGGLLHVKARIRDTGFDRNSLAFWLDYQTRAGSPRQIVLGGATLESLPTTIDRSYVIPADAVPNSTAKLRVYLYWDVPEGTGSNYQAINIRLGSGGLPVTRAATSRPTTPMPTATPTVTVQPPPSLPATGPHPLLQVVLAYTTVCAGSGLVLVARRPRTRRH